MLIGSEAECARMGMLGFDTSVRRKELHPPGVQSRVSCVKGGQGGAPS